MLVAETVKHFILKSCSLLFPTAEREGQCLQKNIKLFCAFINITLSSLILVLSPGVPLLVGPLSGFS